MITDEYLAEKQKELENKIGTRHEMNQENLLEIITELRYLRTLIPSYVVQRVNFKK